MGYCPALVTQCPQCVASVREEGVEADRELMLEDARLIREGLWRMVCCTQDAAESLDLRIEDEALTLGRRSWRFAKPWNACRPSASK